MCTIMADSPKMIEWFTQKWKFAENLLQIIQEVDEYVFSSKQIWRNLALHHLLTNGSSAVSGCRQNNNWSNTSHLIV